MPTIKIKDIVKDPSKLKANKIDRDDPKMKKHFEEARKMIEEGNRRSKVDWNTLKNIRFTI